MSESSVPLNPLTQTGEQAPLIPQVMATSETSVTPAMGTTTVQPSGIPNQSDLSLLHQEIEALKQQTMLQQKRNQDLARFLSDDPNQNNPQQASEARLAQLFQNPDAFVNSTVQQAVANTFAQQRNAEQLAQEMREKHADLVPFEPLIWQNAMQLVNQSTLTGAPLNHRSAIETAASQFRDKLQQYSTKAEQRQQQEQMRQNAIPFTVGTTGQIPSDGKISWDSLSDGEFAKARSQYLRGKGISV